MSAAPPGAAPVLPGPAADGGTERRRAKPVTPTTMDMDDTATDDAAERPPYLLAGVVFVAVLALSLATLAPPAQFWDTPEYIAAAYVLGIPHPPGNPLFVILAHVWGMIPWLATYAARINLFSAVASSLAAALFFLVGERWL